MTDKQFHHDYGMANGHAPIAADTVCIDFDGTLFPWGPLFNWEAKPMPGAIETMKRLKDAGYRIIIFTSRMSSRWLSHADEDPAEHIDYIVHLLTKWEIPYDSITSEKVPAVAYVDDKAIEFTGNNWPDIADRLLDR